MYILELYQNNYLKDLVVFDSLEEGKDFVSKIPGYTIEKEDNIEYEYFNPKLSIMKILFLYLDLCLTLKRMLKLFGKKFLIYQSQKIKL